MRFVLYIQLHEVRSRRSQNQIICLGFDNLLPYADKKGNTRRPLKNVKG